MKSTLQEVTGDQVAFNMPSKGNCVSNDTRAEGPCVCPGDRGSSQDNMHIETFHKLLKHNYLETRKNQRLDHLIDVLFRIDLDKKFDQERKFLEK